MNFSKQHTHKCATEACKQEIVHLDDQCRTAKVWCNSCLLAELNGQSSKVKAEWDPYEDESERQEKSTEDDIP